MTTRKLARIALASLLLLLGACGDSRLGSPPPQQEDPLLGPGHAFYWSGDYEGARATWNASLDRARAEGDSRGVADLLTWLGLAAMRSGDYAEARELGQEALEMKLDLGTGHGLARSFNALGLLALAEDRLPDAQRLFESAATAAAAAGETDLQGAAAGNLGLVHAYLGDLTRAAGMLEQMHEVARATGDRRLEANALTNLAMVSNWSGDPGAAIGRLETAHTLYRELGYPLGEQNALGQLATAWSAMGEYESALAALDSALILSQRYGMRDQEAENLGLLGGVYADLGDPRRALRHLEAAAELSGELGLSGERGNILRRSALIHFSLGSTERALADAAAALEAHREADQVFEQIDDLLALAEIHGRSGNAGEAGSMLRNARILAQQVDARGARAAVALAEARLAERAGSPDAVLQAVARVQTEALPADYRTGMESHMLAARAYASLGIMETAAESAGEALTALDRVRGSLASDELRGSFTASSARMYGDVVLILLQLGREEEAFAVADAARSRDLLQRLAGESAVTPGQRVSGDPASGSRELGAAELLLHRIDALLSQLREMETTPPRERGAGAESTRTEIVDRVERLREEYESLTIRTAQRHPRSAGILGATRTEGSVVQASLAAGEVLLHYMLTPQELVIFAINSDRLETLRVPVPADDLASRIRLLRDLWGDRDAAHHLGVPVARGLYELLIAPAARAGLLEGANRLIIVPHGILEQLPFATLQDPATGRFLVQEYFITYLRSANLLPTLRAAEHRSAGTSRLNAFAPFPVALPGTRAEAVEASRSTRRGALYLDRRASEAAVRRALESSDVVHVASHGVVNAHNPMFSRIELARGSRGDSADDGRLEVHEVLKLTVNSPLVVLSGCETGMAEDWSGDPLRPAGVATLAQAFLHAGARNVMATLWRIDDEGSANLVSHFYRNLAGGDVSRALALAQRTLIRESAYSSPYYWAGFVLVGEGHLEGSIPGLATNISPTSAAAR
jgi:CHAT domain-containing protein